MDSRRGVGFDGRVAGAGPLVVMIPSLGRGGADFDMLAAAMREHGYSTLPLDGRIIATAREQTFADIADEVVEVCAALAASHRWGDRPLYLLGHAYGQSLARCIVSRHPDVFDALILLACGGSPAGPHLRPSLEAATDDELARTRPSEHLAHVARAFFAPGSDPSVWASGWHRELAEVERETMQRTPFEQWRSAGLARTLVVQGIHDVIAPPESGRSFVERIPTARLVEVEGAGHALLPEQPDVVAAAVIAFLDRTAAEIRSSAFGDDELGPTLG